MSAGLVSFAAGMHQGLCRASIKARSRWLPPRAFFLCISALCAVGLPLALANGAAPTETAAATIELAPGSARTLTFDVDIGSAFVADPEKADVNVLDLRRLFVLGRSPGITSLQVRDAEGGLLGAFAVRVNVEPSFAETVVRRVAGGNADIDVEAVGEALFVSGTAQSPAQAERLLRGIRAVTPAPVVDALSLRTPPQINLDVVISEVSRNVTQQFGIDWSLARNTLHDPFQLWAEEGEGTRVATGALSFITEAVTFGDPETGLSEVTYPTLTVEPTPRSAQGGILLSHSKSINSGENVATAFIEALAQNGLLVVHARPTLTTVSGQPASFFSGLEIPVPTIAERGTVGTEYRQTGVELTFTPTVLDRDHISIAVQPRIRELATGGTNIAGAFVPNVNERSASTTVELGDGESIAIAGLYRRSTNSSESGIPMLKDIPLWGSLFRSVRETDRSVELVITVTPRIVAALPRAALAARPMPSASAQQLANEFHY